MRHVPVVTWVVDETHPPGKPKMTVVCEQPEWDALQQTQPNGCVLVRGGITNEGEAERLARSGAVAEKGKAARATAGPPGNRDTQRAALTTFMDQSKRLSAGESLPAGDHTKTRS